MPFDNTESSTFGGAPIRLYEFRRGGKRWYYTTAEKDVTLTVGGEEVVFLATASNDDGVTQSGDTTRNELVIHLPYDNPIVELFRGTPPLDEVAIITRSNHYGEGDAPIIWWGRVVQSSRVDDAQSSLTCQPRINSYSRGGLRLCWERNCPHGLYDFGCKVNRADYAIGGTILSAVGNVVRAAAYASKPDGWFSGGMIEWDLGDDTYDRRMVQSHDGEYLTIYGGTDGITPGNTVRAYPGCGRDEDTCFEKFSNFDNYGGYPFMPGESPFGGKALM